MSDRESFQVLNFKFGKLYLFTLLGHSPLWFECLNLFETKEITIYRKYFLFRKLQNHENISFVGEFY